MYDNQVAILVLAGLLITFRGYFAYLDVKAGVRPHLSFIMEMSLSILAIVVLAAVYWIERVFTIAIVSTVLALVGHSYSLYMTRKASQTKGLPGFRSVAGDTMAVVGCVGMLTVSVGIGQAWSPLLTVFVATYLFGVAYGYLQRRRLDRDAAGVASR